MNSQEESTKLIAKTYFASWKAKDFDSFRALLDDNVTFRGPLGQADNADECIEGIKGMSQIVEGIVIQKMFVDGHDVLTWFDLHTKDNKKLSVANWSHIENQKIKKILVIFDPRPVTSD